VADLVAFLVSTCSRLRVVTTTRAPLAIAAERVFALGQLSVDAAADLFRQRALAARPGLALDDGTVRRVVRRLDGLPLAIELAAAKVRVMLVGDIDRRLDDRFALLRGGDRSAPDRQQTTSRPERTPAGWGAAPRDGRGFHRVRFPPRRAPRSLGTGGVPRRQDRPRPRPVLWQYAVKTARDRGVRVRHRCRPERRLLLRGDGSQVVRREADEEPTWTVQMYRFATPG
jgi:hypothetical protein